MGRKTKRYQSQMSALAKANEALQQIKRSGKFDDNHQHTEVAVANDDDNEDLDDDSACEMKIRKLMDHQISLIMDYMGSNWEDCAPDDVRSIQQVGTQVNSDCEKPDDVLLIIVKIIMPKQKMH